MALELTIRTTDRGEVEPRVALLVRAVSIGEAFVGFDHAVAIDGAGRADAGIFEAIAVQLLLAMAGGQQQP
jgi:hypothetical protein